MQEYSLMMTTALVACATARLTRCWVEASLGCWSREVDQERQMSRVIEIMSQTQSLSAYNLFKPFAPQQKCLITACKWKQ